MRHLIRRFWICERGAGLVEYGLLLGVLALALIGVLALYRDAVGDLTQRTASTVTRQSGRGYGSTAASIRTASADEPSDPGPTGDPEPPDSAGAAAASPPSGLPVLAIP